MGVLSQTKPSFVGAFSLDGLTPASRANQPVTEATLGQSVRGTSSGEGELTIEEPNACASLLPDRRREDYRDRMSELFDIYLFQTLRGDQTSITIPPLSYALPIEKGHGSGEVISGRIGLSRIIGFVDPDELKYYEQCCRYTGICGDQMIDQVYSVEQDIRYLRPQDQTLVKSVSQSELSNSDQGQRLAQPVYEAQAKQSPQKPVEIWTHFTHRALPEPISPPLNEAHIIVMASPEPIRCKQKKSKSSQVVQLDIELKGVDSAREALGYKIVTSKLWSDLTMLERKRRVKMSGNEIVCIPGPDAFTSPDDRCPATLSLSALPPICETLKGDVVVDWSAEFGVYAPGDEKETQYHSHKHSTSVVIKK